MQKLLTVNSNKSAIQGNSFVNLPNGKFTSLCTLHPSGLEWWQIAFGAEKNYECKNRAFSKCVGSFKIMNLHSNTVGKRFHPAPPPIPFHASVTSNAIHFENFTFNRRRCLNLDGAVRCQRVSRGSRSTCLIRSSVRFPRLFWCFNREKWAERKTVHTAQLWDRASRIRGKRRLSKKS